jgi:hypothetical protein
MEAVEATMPTVTVAAEAVLVPAATELTTAMRLHPEEMDLAARAHRMVALPQATEGIPRRAGWAEAQVEERLPPAVETAQGAMRCALLVQLPRVPPASAADLVVAVPMNVREKSVERPFAQMEKSAATLYRAPARCPTKPAPSRTS